MMQLFLFFFGVALFDLEVSLWLAASLALTFWTSAFLTEIWRGWSCGNNPLTAAGAVELKISCDLASHN